MRVVKEVPQRKRKTSPNYGDNHWKWQDGGGAVLGVSPLHPFEGCLLFLYLLVLTRDRGFSGCSGRGFRSLNN